MNKLYKTVLLAALGLASFTAAQAQEMYLGFNDSGAFGGSGAQSYQNDYVIDLGAVSLFTANSTYSGTINQSTFNTAFSSDANYLNNVAAGVVGADGLVNGFFYGTYASLPTAKTRSAVNNANSDAGGLVAGEYSSVSGGPNGSDGWSYLVGVAPDSANTLNGAQLNPAGTEIAQTAGNPESRLSSGVLSFNLYDVNASKTTGNAWTLLGTFNINANPGVDTISYTGVSAVPEPGTYGLFAGAGLLLLGLRRQFTAKNA